MSDGEATSAGVRERTRRAILSAAAATIARNRSATLSDIADAAKVGRSTVHRYFSSREELIAETIVDSLTAVQQAVADAQLDQGSARAALRRLVAAMVEVGDRIIFLFGDTQIYERLSEQPAPGPDRDPVITLIERGQANGTFNPDVSAVWIQNVLWALVYTGLELYQDGRILKHDVVPNVIQTLESGVLAGER